MRAGGTLCLTRLRPAAVTPVAGRLYMAAAPLGNMSDITQRATSGWLCFSVPNKGNAPHILDVGGIFRCAVILLLREGCEESGGHMANALNMRSGITLGCVWISSMNANVSIYPEIARVAPPGARHSHRGRRGRQGHSACLPPNALDRLRGSGAPSEATMSCIACNQGLDLLVWRGEYV